MFIEPAIAAVLALLGGLTLALLSPGLRRIPLIAYGGVAGLLLVAVPAAVPVMFGQPMGPIWAVGAALAFAVLMWFRRGSLYTAAMSALVASVFTFLLALSVTLLVAPVLTADSWRFLEYGSSLFDDGHSIETLQQKLASYPLLLTAAEGTVRSLRIPFMASGVSSIGLMACIGSIALMLSRPSNRIVRFGLVGGATLVVASSTYLLRVQLGYVNSHVVTAGLLSMGAASFFAGARQLSRTSLHEERAWLLAIACCGLGLARVEGLLLVGLVMAAAMSVRQWNRRALTILASVGVLMPSAWYGVLAFTGESGGILSRTRILALAAVAIGPLSMRWVFGSRWSRSWVAPLTLTALGLGALLIYMLRPDAFEDSVRSMALNLSVRGLWGGVWCVLIPLGALALVFVKEQLSPWILSTFGYVILVVLLGGIREFPYRVGWGDSGNRMMVHVVPVFVMLAIVAFGRERALDGDDLVTE